MKFKFSFPLLAVILLMTALPSVGNSQKPQRKQTAVSSGSSTQTVTRSSAHRFPGSWARVDSLANIGQPRSALEIVDSIYARARAAQDDPQVIKAVIYRIRLNSEFRENFMVQTIADLQKEISASVPPAQQMLQSILAEVYWKYYQNNQYRFRNRSRVTAVLPDKPETWDLETIFRTITKTWLQSIDDPEALKKIPTGEFEAILDLELFDSPQRDTLKSEAVKFVPTLYDFLAGRALDFFTSGETGQALKAFQFEVDQPWFFAQPAVFAGNRMMIPDDPSAPAGYALKIFRDLAAFHLTDKDPRALIGTELKRFAFVHEKYILPGKDSLYHDALRQFDQAESASPWGTSISYALASFLNSQGQQYQPLVSDNHHHEIRSALEVCDQAIKRFPGSEGSKNCKILASSIREPSLQLTTESAVPVGKPSLALAGVKNLKQIYLRLVRTDPGTYSDKSATVDRAGFFKYLASLPAAKSWAQNFPVEDDYQKHQAEIAVPEVPAGYWVLLGAASEDFSESKVYAFTPFWSTQISYVSKRNDDGSYGYFLLDRSTGLPLKNAVAEAWEKNYDYRERKYTDKKLERYTADDRGYILIPPAENNGRNTNVYLKIYFKDDLLISGNFYQYPVYKGREQVLLQTMFYTDRAIYRPGQTIYFKGIILERTGDQSKIKVKHPTKVVFTDVNGQKVSELTLTTNEFGSVNGSFVAPAGVLPGQMTIYNESGSVYISVEEYKRPTFDVSCDPLEGNFKLGEMLKVTGKAMAFAGNPVDGAMVRYRVVRSARFPFWDWGWRYPMPASPEVEISNGTTTTGAEGSFVLQFPAVPDPGIDPKTWPVFDYSVSVDVTDINGETQSTEKNVAVGYKSLVIGTNIPELVNASADTGFTLTTTNLNGRNTPAMVTISMQRLRQPDRVLVKRSWERPDVKIMTREEFHARFPYNDYDDESNPATWAVEGTVLERTINTAADSAFRLHDPASPMPQPGSYLLILKTTDPFGEVVEVKKYLTIFSPDSREVPVNTLSWFVPLKTKGAPGETARFMIGSKEDNINMIYEVRLRDSLVSREILRISDRAMVLEIPIREEYRGNFGVTFLFVKHNRVFQHNRVITVPYADKKLRIEFETFRSKIDPGAKEIWKMKFSDPGGKPARAEFLAAMYDASLDQFRPNEWSFSLYQRYSGIVPWDVDDAFRTSFGQWVSPNEMNEGYYFHPGLKLNWFGTSYFGNSMRYSKHSARAGDKSMRMEMMDAPSSMPEPTAGVNTASESGANPKAVSDSAGMTGNGVRPTKTLPEPAVQVRRDFRETAFFYPVMETDSSGSLVLQFTAPESLTRWKLLGLAHTKNLGFGLVEKEVVTSKDLMVFPNAPRFVRQGDTVIFSTKIVNLYGHDLAGKVSVSFSDGLTLRSLNRLVDTISGAGKGLREQDFSMLKGQSTVVSWTLVIPVDPALSVLQYRVMASSGNFSDGEEKSIPVLPNRMLVTESLPLPVRGKGTTGFKFSKLLSSGSASATDATLRNYKLTLEFASNPAWYAVQALPSLNDRQYETADAIFAAYWSNSMAAFIAGSSPKIKAVFDAWKDLTPDALLSNLEKNQQLKSALLQETPWVMEATGETGRKKKLGLFFDADNINANLQRNLGQLQKLQTPNGGWTWFEGMPENRYITQNILTGLGKLYHLGITRIMKDPGSRDMVVKAIGYLDGELEKDYENLKKYRPENLAENHLGSLQVQYLYARSFFMNDPSSRIPDLTPGAAEAFSYYKGQARKYWLRNDRYLQGMIALALNRIDSGEIPAMIMKSLSEKALHSDEMGMYWAEERGFFWYQAPIEAQALMIEAYDEVAQDKGAVEELKIWLLKQKQTQDWRSPRATLEACYALLLRGTDLLSDDPQVKITLGKEKINSEKLRDVKTEAGTGYFQMSWSGSEISPEMGNITVSKTGEGIAWGAIYWQYFENLDKITPASTPLHLEKKLFVSGLPVVTDSVSLKTGDKLTVRIVLTVDRDLEFVHMKDMRASALEPVNSAPGPFNRYGAGSGTGLSGYRYQDGLGYYQATTDQATNFFFDYLPKGTYVFEYGLKVNAAGEYSNGITTIQCMYAPEFTAHSEGIRITVR